MKPLNERDLERMLGELNDAETLTPPADLADRIKAEIPDDLADLVGATAPSAVPVAPEEADDSEEEPAQEEHTVVVGPWSRQRRWALAASLVTLLGAGIIARNLLIDTTGSGPVSDTAYSQASGESVGAETERQGLADAGSDKGRSSLARCSPAEDGEPGGFASQTPRCAEKGMRLSAERAVGLKLAALGGGLAVPRSASVRLDTASEPQVNEECGAQVWSSGARFEPPFQPGGRVRPDQLRPKARVTNRPEGEDASRAGCGLKSTSAVTERPHRMLEFRRRDLGPYSRSLRDYYDNDGVR